MQATPLSVVPNLICATAITKGPLGSSGDTGRRISRPPHRPAARGPPLLAPWAGSFPVVQAEASAVRSSLGLPVPLRVVVPAPQLGHRHASPRHPEADEGSVAVAPVIAPARERDHLP